MKNYDPDDIGRIIWFIVKLILVATGIWFSSFLIF